MPGTSTLLLDRSTWDLVLDADGNIAVASAPYSLAQDAASAIRTFLGECLWDTTIGVPFLTLVFSPSASVAQVQAVLAAAAETVPGVESATVTITRGSDRTITGQVQVTSAATGETSTAEFQVINPQGGG